MEVVNADSTFDETLQCIQKLLLQLVNLHEVEVHRLQQQIPAHVLDAKDSDPAAGRHTLLGTTTAAGDDHACLPIRRSEQLLEQQRYQPGEGSFGSVKKSITGLSDAVNVQLHSHSQCEYRKSGSALDEMAVPPSHIQPLHASRPCPRADKLAIPMHCADSAEVLDDVFSVRRAAHLFARPHGFSIFSWTGDDHRSEKFFTADVKERVCARMEALFQTSRHTTMMITPQDLLKAARSGMKQHTRRCHVMDTLSVADMEDALLELTKIYQKSNKSKRSTMASSWKRGSNLAVISWRHLVSCILIEELHTHAEKEDMMLKLFILQSAFLGEDMPAARTTPFMLQAQATGVVSHRWRQCMKNEAICTRVVTILSTAAIIASVASVGIAMDTDTGDGAGWVAMEVVCACIFVLEIVVKTCVLGPCVYFCGPACHWNLFDVFLSSMAILEAFFSSVLGEGFHGASHSRAAMVLRCFRIARMARLAKLLRMPLMEELATIISGFLISLRPLFWVTLALFAVVYFLALAMRSTLETFSTPESGDQALPMQQLESEDLRAVLDFADSYCGSVMGCQFTVFRCILGDCTTADGENLVAIFSKGFGTPFDFVYCSGMVVVFFGLFNVITAIFVEATLKGLKESEAQVKFARLHESSFVVEKMRALVAVSVRHVKEQRQEPKQLYTSFFRTLTGHSIDSQGSHAHEEEIFMTQPEFLRLLRAPEVRQLLCDLDVQVEPWPEVFDTFNIEEDGSLSMSELITGLMRFRGDLSKMDICLVQEELARLHHRLKG